MEQWVLEEGVGESYWRVDERVVRILLGGGVLAMAGLELRFGVFPARK